MKREQSGAYQIGKLTYDFFARLTVDVRHRPVITAAMRTDAETVAEMARERGYSASSTTRRAAVARMQRQIYESACAEDFEDAALQGMLDLTEALDRETSGLYRQEARHGGGIG